jgi:hypothetical protein
MGVKMLPIKKIERRDAVAVPSGRLLPDTHNSFGAWKGQRPKKNGVYKTEDGRVGANPERQRENRHGCEARAVPDHAEAKTKIPDQLVHMSVSC